MFVREVKKRLKGVDGKSYDYVHHRLVESIRTPYGPRQKVILNLGTLDIPKTKHKTLANLIEAVVRGNNQLALFDDNNDLTLQALAYHYAELIMQKRTVQHQEQTPTDEKETPAAQYEKVDVNSTTTSQNRTIAGEYIALSQLRQLSFFRVLKTCGFSEKQQQYAAAQIVARMVHPSSERESARWLRDSSALGELLGADFSRLSDHTLHRTADQLLDNKDRLEQKLSAKSRDLFSLDESLILYDLTNTYFESPKCTSTIAKYGKSKEKRTDCPLVTLALVVDAQGFPKRSRLFAGNVSEPKTLWEIIDQLVDDKSPKAPKTVIIDAGIATEDNLARLRDDKRFEYVAISRKKKYAPDLFANSEAYEVQCGRDKILNVRMARTAEEVYLLCQSPERFAKDEGIFNRRKQRFEKGLLALKAGLSKPRTRKSYRSVVERIGRLKERFKMGKYYTIDITTTEDSTTKDTCRVTDIKWYFDADKRNEPGEYVIRTSRTELDEEQLSLLHRTLTMIESAFRWLKSALGLHPNYHQLDRRMEAHVFVSVLGYFTLAPLLHKLGWGGEVLSYREAGKKHVDYSSPYGWQSVMSIMSTQERVTTSQMRPNGSRIHIRTTHEPTAQQRFIYQRLNMPAKPLGRIVWTGED